MERVRRNGMIDINAAIEQGLIQYNEAEVHGARKNKFWFNNINGNIKCPHISLPKM